jgi:Ser/Thr protein kinase RdoA (MazF antagonist)
MLERVKLAFTQSVLNQALAFYELTPESCHILGGFENISYTCTKDEKSYIMRFVHSSHRHYKLVYAELAFIDHLSLHQVPVSHIKKTVTHKLAERCYAHDGYFTVTLSSKINGQFLKVPMHDPIKIERLGALVGQMHQAVMTFKPKYKRLNYDKNTLLKDAKPYLEDQDKDIIHIYKDTLKQLKGIKKTPLNFGLIHNDLHQHNMFDDDETITPIDFDDACYHYKLSDLSMIVFYHYMFLSIPENIDDTLTTFIQSFLKGYRKHHACHHVELRHIPLLIRYRQLQLYFTLIATGERSKYEAFFKLHTPYITSEKALCHMENILSSLT